MKKIWLYTAIFIVCCCMASGAEPSPWDSWRSAYTTFEQGESARDRGDYLEALKCFEQSLKDYQRVKRARPNWNQRVISARMSTCEQEIAKMRRLLGTDAPPETETPEPPKTVATTPDAELRQAQVQLHEVQNELEELRRQNQSVKSLQDEVVSLMRDLRTIREEYALLEKRNRSLEQRLQAPDLRNAELQKQIVDMKVKYDELTRLYDFSKQRLSEMEQKLRQQELAQHSNQVSSAKRTEAFARLTKEYEQLQERLQHYERNNAKLSEENQRLQVKINEQLAKLNAALKEIEALKKSGGEKINTAAANAERERFNTELAHRNQEIAALTQKITAQEQLIAELSQTSEQLRKNFAEQQQSLQQNYQNLQEQHNASLSELEALKNQRDTLEASLTQAVSKSLDLEKRLIARESADLSGAAESAQVRQQLENELEEQKKNVVRLQTQLSDISSRFEQQEKYLSGIKAEMNRLRAEHQVATENEADLRRDLNRLADADKQLEQMRRNFTALQAENQELKLSVEAAKPREAEIARIKLRLAELERLQSSLSREQQLNEELNRVNRQLQKEITEFSGMRDQLFTLKKQLAEMEPLKKEVERLRQINQELADNSKATGEILQLKAELAKLQPLQLEVENLRKLNQQYLTEREKLVQELGEVRNFNAGAQLLNDELNRTKSKLSITEAILSHRNQELEAVKQELLNVSSIGQVDHSELFKRLSDQSRGFEDKWQKMLDGSAKDASGVLQKRITELLKENEQLKTEEYRLRAVETEYITIMKEVEKLRLLVGDSVSAGEMSAELAKLKLELSRMEQLKDELAKVNALNRELFDSRAALEKELENRPRLTPAGMDFGIENITLSKSNENPEDLINAGRLAEANGNLELARWYYEEAYKIDPKSKDAARRAGLMALIRLDYQRAVEVLAPLRDLEPENEELTMALARAYTGSKRFGNVLALLEPMSSNKLDDPDFQTLFSAALAGCGRNADAENALRSALRVKPDDPDLMLALAKFICNVDSSRLNEAVSLYERARNAGAPPDLEMEPKLGSMLDERRDLASFLTDAAREAENGKDWRTAAWYYRQLVQMDWNSEITVAQLALSRHMADDPSAIEAIEFSGKKTPLSQLVMVLIELKNQNHTAALASAKLAKHLNNDKKVIIPLEIPNLAIELSIAVSKCPEKLRTELLENFSLEVGVNKISATQEKLLDK